MTYTARWTELNAVLERMEPGGYNGPYTTAYVSLRDYQRVVFLIECGTLGGAVDAQVYQATDTAGTGAKVVAGKAITQLTATDDNALVAIEVRTEELDVDGAFDCVAILITPQGMNYMSCLVIGYATNYAAVPTTAFDEIVD